MSLIAVITTIKHMHISNGCHSLAVSTVTGVSIEEMASRSRQSGGKTARYVLIGVCRDAGCKFTELQSQLKKDLSVLSR
jgi:hypothetical protein